MSASSAKKDALLHKYKKVNSLPLIRMRTRPKQKKLLLQQLLFKNFPQKGGIVSFFK
jgi:hypothetical protein